MAGQQCFLMLQVRNELAWSWTSDPLAGILPLGSIDCLRWADGCLLRLPGGNLYGGEILFLEASKR